MSAEVPFRDPEEARREARRKLLKIAAWTVPAILGTFRVARGQGKPSKPPKPCKPLCRPRCTP
ncbi:MAG: hypothetical protein L0216_16115 [Planctomycetales bacterium]|nr:hypothetical protein [Planctomycetales bacterium]